MEIHGGNIRIHKGEECVIRVKLRRDGEPYTMRKTDRLRLVVKKDAMYVQGPVLERESIGRAEIKLRYEDTQKLGAVRYEYEILLTTGQGQIYTVAGPGKMEVIV